MIQNIERVHPIKREKVLRGLQFIEAYNTTGIVKRILLFGSAVTSDCTEESDIDFCFVSDGTCEDPVFFSLFGGLPLAVKDLCDILVYQDLKGKIKEEIDKKGVVVYEYQSH